jgi:hypothetical protein
VKQLEKSHTATIINATNPLGEVFSKTEPDLRRMIGAMILMMYFESKRPPGYYNGTVNCGKVGEKRTSTGLAW